ncbi:hypothetical protein [Pseudocolwellia agarivorans]|uniref:hypothetical protein n=1 Tax=Pseudocolwellia agarivorans TaxID=1911682 RepID=UPI003F88568B
MSIASLLQVNLTMKQIKVDVREEFIKPSSDYLIRILESVLDEQEKNFINFTLMYKYL